MLTLQAESVVATSFAHLTKVDPALKPTFQQAINLLTYTYFSEESNQYIVKALHIRSV